LSLGSDSKRKMEPCPSPSVSKPRLQQQTLRPTERHCGSVGRWSGATSRNDTVLQRTRWLGREDHTLEGMPTGNNAPSQVPMITHKQEPWRLPQKLRWSPRQQKTSPEAHSGGCHKQGGCPDEPVPQEDCPEAQGPGLVRIDRWTDAAGWMQEEVADHNNNKRSDLSPTSSAHSRLKQGPMDDSHREHEPQAVSALMNGPAVSEPQAVSVAEIFEAGTVDMMWLRWWADAAGWAQDEVADDNNNKCSDLTMQAQYMNMIFEALYTNMFFGADWQRRTLRTRGRKRTGRGGLAEEDAEDEWRG
jgi:hypothetical protein